MIDMSQPETATQTKPISSAMGVFENRKAYYLELRGKLEQSGKLLDKHKKTIEASRNEAEARNRDWKSAIRESGGNMTTAVREMKRQELAARETADEFSSLTNQLEPQFSDMRALVCSARHTYLLALDRAEEQLIDEKLECSAANILNTDAGQELLELLMFRVSYIELKLRSDEGENLKARAAPAAMGVDVDEFLNDKVIRKVQGFVYSFLEKHRNISAAERFDDLGIEVIPIGEYELNETNASTVAAGQAAKRLKVAGLI
jgi:hypothetical protein